MAYLQKKSPPAYIKRSVLNKIVNEGERPSVRPSRGNWTIAASLVLALTSLFVSVYFWNQWQESESKIAELITQNIEIARNYRNTSSELESVRKDLQVLIQPEYQRVVMKGTENAPLAQAVVYWDPSNNEVFLNSSTLPALSADEQYQLWALVDGVPTDAGIFDANQLDFQKMKEIAKADAFAVTIEPRGGSKTPSLEKLQVVGEV